MALILGPNELVLYPQPYIEAEATDLVVTTQRMVRMTDAGVAEFPVGKITYVGRIRKRPLALVGLILLVAALGALGFGLFNVFSNLPSSVPKVPPIDLPPIPGVEVPAAAKKAGEMAKKAGLDGSGDDDDDDADDEVGLGFFPGLGFSVGGLLALVGGVLLIRIRKFQVNFRTDEGGMFLDTKDEQDQKNIVGSLGTAMNTNRMMEKAKAAAMPKPVVAAPAPVVDMFPGMDPVLALQSLKELKDKGKVDQPTYEKQRSMLLEKLAARRG